MGTNWQVKILGVVSALALSVFVLGAGCSSNSSTSSDTGGDDEEEGEEVIPGAVYYNDDGIKDFGLQPPPPLFVNPEAPSAGSEIDIEVDIDGATTIAFTVDGDGCGTVASTEGDNPLTVTGTVADRGHCDLTATATVDGEEQVYEGEFAIDATDPDIPPITLAGDDVMWEQDDIPDAEDGGPVITDIAGADSIAGGSTTTYTVTYTSADNTAIAGVFLKIGDHPHGFFYAPASGSDGQASFDVIVDPDYTADDGQWHDLIVALVDEDDLIGTQFTKTVSVSPAEANEAVNPAASDSYSVAGTVKYEKFIVNSSGRSQTGTMIPVRKATVKALNASDNATVLGQGTTGEDGSYKITFTSSSAPSYKVQVYATNADLNQTVANKRNSVYAFRSTTTVNASNEPQKTGLDIEIMEADNAGAFNIWDLGVTTNAYVRSSTGTAPPKLTIYWARGDATGSYYTTDSSDNAQIWMRGATSDPDEYDDTVIGHEYGHFVMAKLGTDDSPGGDHTLDTFSLPTLALSEGWATFLAGASLGTSMYLDSNADGLGVSYSFETPPADAPRGTEGSVLAGNINEVIVNAVLWDLFDKENETKDTLRDNSVAIWKVITTYLKSGYANFADRGYAGRDLVDFLDGWICLGYGNIGDNDSQGLKGASIGLMQVPSSFVKSDLGSCQ